MTSWIEQIIAALGAAGLEAIFVRSGAAAITGSTTATIDLLVRDTPIHRERVRLVAQTLGCARIPVSDTARTIRLVGGLLPIDIVYGQLGAESYGAVRARAARFGKALVASALP